MPVSTPRPPAPTRATHALLGVLCALALALVPTLLVAGPVAAEPAAETAGDEVVASAELLPVTASIVRTGPDVPSPAYAAVPLTLQLDTSAEGPAVAGFWLDGLPQGPVWYPNDAGAVGVVSVAVEEFLPAGSTTLTLRFEGDEHHVATSGSLTVVTTSEPPSVEVAVRTLSGEVTFRGGEDVIVTATLETPAGSPSSTVRPYLGDVTFTLADGSQATVPVTPSRSEAVHFTAVAVGTQTITATTVADPYFASGSASVTFEGDRGSTFIDYGTGWTHALEDQTVSMTPHAGGRTITPTGEIEMLLVTGDLPTDRTSLGAVPIVDGEAVWTGRLPVGTHRLVMSYAGDTQSAPTNGFLTASISAAPTTTTIETPGLVFGEEGVATVRVVVPGAPAAVVGGQVELTADGAPLGSAPLVDGAASFTVPAQVATGELALEATYLGDAQAVASTGELVATVQRAVPGGELVVPDELVLGEPWTVEAFIGAQFEVDQPAELLTRAAELVLVLGTGTLSATLDGVEVASAPLVDGQAAVTVETADWDLAPGTHVLEVVYGGDTNFHERTFFATAFVVEADPVVTPPVTDPPVTDPPVVDPPVVDPPVADLPETEPSAPGGGAVVPTDPTSPVQPGTVATAPLPGAVAPAAATEPEAHTTSTQAARAGDLAQTGSSVLPLVLLGPLLLGGAAVLATRRRASALRV